MAECLGTDDVLAGGDADHLLGGADDSGSDAPGRSRSVHLRAVEKIRKLDFEHGVGATFLPRVELAKRAADLLLSDCPKREAAGIRRPLQRQLRSGQPHVAF